MVGSKEDEGFGAEEEESQLARRSAPGPVLVAPSRRPFGEARDAMYALVSRTVGLDGYSIAILCPQSWGRGVVLAEAPDPGW